ncbi:MAG TPA: amidase [Gemmatimonadales bacterium]|nr:amidase [Gemmatimonadales bacterium]
MRQPDRTLDRRSFIHSSVLAGLATAIPPTRGGLVQAAPVARGPAAPAAFELEEITIAQLQAGMTSGQYSARGLVELYRARIEALDERTRSVIELNPEAPAIAEAMDAERRQKKGGKSKLRGPLHGIPVVIKDNIATADKMETTAGSLALVGAKPAHDAALVARLRAAGAVILGKTNLSEWANYRSSHSSSGWSGRGGQCRNPYALDRTPSGSSSGSGVAISANFCAVGVGTETDGSVVSPASHNGIVGIKPTLGLVSRSGIIPIAHSQDTAGPMARTVADAAVLLGVMAGVDPADPATAAATGKIAADYTSFLDSNGLKGARIGIPRNKGLVGFHPGVDAVLTAAIDVLTRQGAVVVDPADILTQGQFDDAENDVLAYEFKHDLELYLAALGPGSPKTLADLIAWNTQHKDQELPYFGQETFEKSQAKGPLTDQAYLDALAKSKNLSQAQGIDAVMDKNKLDALVSPTDASPSLIDLVNGDHWLGGSSTPAAVAGYPHVTVPGGFVFGLPVGISFYGRAWSEGLLIKLAYAFEQATKARRQPTFRASVDLG